MGDNKALEDIINDLIDPSDCTYDHDGNCQSHDWSGSNTCPHARAKELLGSECKEDLPTLLREAADWINHQSGPAPDYESLMESAADEIYRLRQFEWMYKDLQR